KSHVFSTSLPPLPSKQYLPTYGSMFDQAGRCRCPGTRICNVADFHSRMLDAAAGLFPITLLRSERSLEDILGTLYVSEQLGEHIRERLDTGHLANRAASPSPTPHPAGRKSNAESRTTRAPR